MKLKQVAGVIKDIEEHTGVQKGCIGVKKWYLGVQKGCIGVKKWYSGVKEGYLGVKEGYLMYIVVTVYIVVVS